MAEPCYGDPRYLVLHFCQGKLFATKVCHSWRGVQMSKRNFEKLLDGGPNGPRALVRVLPLDAILAMKGIEQAGDLSAEDAKILAEMGITA